MLNCLARVLCSWISFWVAATFANNFFLKVQGGMSNELYNTIARVTDGIYEGMPTWWLFRTPLYFMVALMQSYQNIFQVLVLMFNFHRYCYWRRCVPRFYTLWSCSAVQQHSSGNYKLCPAHCWRFFICQGQCFHFSTRSVLDARLWIYVCS